MRRVRIPGWAINVVAVEFIICFGKPDGTSHLVKTGVSNNCERRGKGGAA